MASVHPNAELIDQFYSAFARSDHATMGGSYTDSATFGDPVFTNLDVDEARAMWRMFCTSGNPLEITHSDVEADDKEGRAHWEARYAFPPTKRPVHNVIEARFRFDDGKISHHRDSFGLYRWTRMALGPVGVALGWSPIVTGKVRSQARAQLDSFMASE